MGAFYPLTVGSSHPEQGDSLMTMARAALYALGQMLTRADIVERRNILDSALRYLVC
jgi:hypothetical protein